MNRKSVHIIGGGVIGLCSAYFLNKKGYEVSVIDAGNFENGTSYGNAGMIVPSHFEPMAAPGVWKQGLQWMLNARSPFYIRPRINLELFQWLFQFLKHSNVEHTIKSSLPLLRLHERSKALYEELQGLSGFEFGFQKKGLLMLYQSAKQQKKEITLAQQAEKMGLESHIISRSEVEQLNPGLDLSILGGHYFPGDAHLVPEDFMRDMKCHLIENGVHLISNFRIVKFKSTDKTVTHVVDENGQIISIDRLIVAAGSHSGELLKKLNINFPIQDGKGYSFDLKGLTGRPTIPTILSEAKVALTPMHRFLRVGGTLEISGHSTRINLNRVKGIIESLSRYYSNITAPALDDLNVWVGYRPCSATGIPMIGKIESYKNLFVNTGHGMMGMSLGPASGELISEIFFKRADDHHFKPQS